MTAISRLVSWPIITFLSFLLLFGILTSFATAERPEIIRVNEAAVATDDERCSIIGVDILTKGGNAIDAAVAAALCLGVVSAASSGIGGGAFIVLRLANGTITAIDTRETAPMKASANMYHGNLTKKEKGPLSIAVPSELKGLYYASEQYGALPWKALVEPSIRLAEAFQISTYLFSELVIVEEDIFADKGLSEIYTLNGRLLQTGQYCYNKKLAETLRNISNDGVEAFFNGPIGENIIQDIQELGGILTMDDLRKYEFKIRNVTYNKFFGLEMYGMPPPSAGGVGSALMLNILANYDFPGGIMGTLGSHRMVEAIKHTFAVRANIGDPDFINVTEVVSDMLSKEFAKELMNTIYDYTTFGAEHYGGKWNPIHEYSTKEHGTSHLSVVDKNGNAVGLTSSVNYYFGSRILSPRTGILLNNQMDDFSIPSNDLIELEPAGPSANYIAPGKRPLSSMSPTIILEEGTLKGVVGASGGTMIFSGAAQVILNHFVKGMDPLDAVMNPRLYHWWLPNNAIYEDFISVTGDHFTVSNHTMESLKQKGHILERIGFGAICQFIVLNSTNGSMVAVSDPRKGGIPAGY